MRTFAFLSNKSFWLNLGPRTKQLSHFLRVWELFALRSGLSLVADVVAVLPFERRVPVTTVLRRLVHHFRDFAPLRRPSSPRALRVNGLDSLEELLCGGDRPLCSPFALAVLPFEGPLI